VRRQSEARRRFSTQTSAGDPTPGVWKSGVALRFATALHNFLAHHRRFPLNEAARDEQLF
jgi:hypothetical protein